MKHVKKQRQLLQKQMIQNTLEKILRLTMLLLKALHQVMLMIVTDVIVDVIEVQALEEVKSIIKSASFFFA